MEPDEVDISDMQAAYELEQQMLAEGKTQAEVDQFMAACRRFAVETEITKMREAGVPEVEILAFWQELESFGDIEPSDTFDVTDYGLVVEVI